MEAAPAMQKVQLLASLERENETLRRQLAEREAMMAVLRQETEPQPTQRQQLVHQQARAASMQAASAAFSARKVDDLTRSFQRLNSDSDLHAAAEEEEARLRAQQLLSRQMQNAQQPDLLRRAAAATGPGGAVAAPLKPLLLDLLMRGDAGARAHLERAEQRPAELQEYLRLAALSEMEQQQRAQQAELDARRRALEVLGQRSAPAQQQQQQQQQQQAPLESKMQRLASTQSAAPARSIVDMLNAFTDASPGSEAPAVHTLSQLRAALQQQQLQQQPQQQPQPPPRVGQTPPPLPRHLHGAAPPPLPAQSAAASTSASPRPPPAEMEAALQRLLQEMKAKPAPPPALPAGFLQPFPVPAPRQAAPSAAPAAAASLHFASAQSLGSKRERPESMQKFTTFREQHRSRTAEDAAPPAALPAAPALAPLPPPLSAGSRQPRRWTADEDELLRAAVAAHGGANWKAIADLVPGRTHVQCLQRWRKALDPDVVKGHWTPEEDALLLRLSLENPKNWGYVARGISGRNPKQCRERYHNHLDPAIKKGDWTPEEDAVIIELQARLGNRWAEIATLLPGRPENSVKIRWKSIQRYTQASSSPQ